MSPNRLVAVASSLLCIFAFGAAGTQAYTTTSPQPTPSSDASGTDVINPPDPRAASEPKPKAGIGYFDRKLLAAQKRKAQADWDRALVNRKSRSSVMQAAAVPGVNQGGLGNSDNTPFAQSAPSDSTGAIGPFNYMEMVNQRIAVYDRSLNRVGSTVDMGIFANFNSRNVTMTDPQVEWDAQANRWEYAVIGQNGGGNYLFYGWSKTNDPSNLSVGGWCRWELSTGNDDYDYPKLGHDGTSIVIGANIDYYPFGYSEPGAFITATILVITKPGNGVTTCTQPTFKQFGSSKMSHGQYVDLLIDKDGVTPTWTPIPANTTDNSQLDYIVAANVVGTPSALNLRHITYARNGTPSLSNDADIAIPSYSIPPSAPQSNSPNYLNTLDARLTQAVARVDPDVSNGLVIWTQHTIAESSSPQPHVRWYEVVTTTMTVRQYGSELGDATTAEFNGAISPTIDGNEAVLVYNQSSATALPNIVAQSRLSSTPLGQLDPVVTAVAVLGTSPSAENDSGCGGTPTSPCRWGDYSSVTPDPLYAHTVWGTNALAGAGSLGFGGWTTKNFAIKTLSQPYCLSTPIAAGYYHSLAVGLDGTVWAWGATGYGQIGHGPTNTNQLTPIQVLGQGGVGTLTGISSVAAGQYHSLALRGSDGSVWSWGNNFDGELGNDDPTGANQNTPVQVLYAQGGSALTGISQIASRNSHSLAIRQSDGTVWAWGLNTYGQLGNTTVPLTLSRGAVQVMGLNGNGFLGGIVKIAVGDNFSVAIDSNGSVYAWGDDSAGQLGDNRSGFGVISTVPIQVHGINNVGVLGGSLKVAARASGTDVVNSDNSLSAWGTGNQPATLTPLIVQDSTGTGSLFPMYAVGAGYSVTYADDYRDNTLWAWGDNSYGQLGDGTTNFHANPVQVRDYANIGHLAPVFAATGGVGHSLAVLQDGTVAAWGRNDGGQLGDGTTANRLIPYQVSLPAVRTPTSC